MNEDGGFPNWQPEQYLRFGEERTRPAIDLAGRVECAVVKRIMDLGCGPGNSTAVLAGRWPDAETVGVDSSRSMLEKARATSESVRWVEHDAARDMTFLGKFDLVFSNAALQWIPDVGELVPRLFGMLNPGGALAVQVPYNQTLPAFAALRELASGPEWREYFSDPSIVRLHHSHRFYYDLLATLSARIDMWQTEYIHIMASHHSIAEWYRGTGLRPFLQALSSDALRERFVAAFERALEKVYPLAGDGKVLFPFPRIFFIAYRRP